MQCSTGGQCITRACFELPITSVSQSQSYASKPEQQPTTMISARAASLIYPTDPPQAAQTACPASPDQPILSTQPAETYDFKTAAASSLDRYCRVITFLTALSLASIIIGSGRRICSSFLDCKNNSCCQRQGTMQGQSVYEQARTCNAG